MKVKKGLLAIGAICIILIIGCIILLIYGQRPFTNYLIKSKIGGLTSTSISPSYFIDIDRNTLNEFLDNLGYVCSESNTSSLTSPIINNTCLKTDQGIDVSIKIASLSSNYKPASIVVSLPIVDNPQNRVIIEKIFREIVQIPYINSEPETVIAWLDNVINIQGIESFATTKNIGNVSFSIGIFKNFSSLTIGPSLDE